MSIQRYGLFSDGDMWPVKEGFGKWVKHDDHKAALVDKEARIERLDSMLATCMHALQFGCDNKSDLIIRIDEVRGQS